MKQAGNGSGRPGMDETTTEETAEAQQGQLPIIASDTITLSGDVQRLVTFLNRSLKDEGFIFGLRRADDERVQLTIYQE